jgi:hypothetical protein
MTRAEFLGYLKATRDMIGDQKDVPASVLHKIVDMAEEVLSDKRGPRKPREPKPHLRGAAAG